MNVQERVSGQPRLPGVIDTLSAGYRTLNRHPYLLAVPVILDLFYWLGPRISAVPVAQQIVQSLEHMRSSSSLGATTPQSVQSLSVLTEMIEDIGQSANLFSLLSSPLSIPTIVASRDLTPPAWLGLDTMLTITTGRQFLSLFVLLFVLGAVIGAVYMGLAAQVVRDGRAHLVAAIRRAGLYAGRYIVLLVGLAMAAMMIGLPLVLLIVLVTLLNATLGSLLMAVMWAAFLWLFVLAFFTVDALFISDASPLMAVLKSITVVRLSTSSTIGLLLVTVIISLGMPYVWGALGTSDIATLVGILGNAYIGTGLTVASMIFYRDRIAVLAGSQPRP